MQSAAPIPAPPKPPKASKVDPIEQVGAEPLGDLGALGGTEPNIRKSVRPPLAAELAIATWSDAEAECAAIVEPEGAVPKAWAEGFALLDPNCPPGDVPARRWQSFLDDVRLFLDSPFCAVAAARLGTSRSVRLRPRSAVRPHRSKRAVVVAERRKADRADREHGYDREA